MTCPTFDVNGALFGLAEREFLAKTFPLCILGEDGLAILISKAVLSSIPK